MKFLLSFRVSDLLDKKDWKKGWARQTVSTCFRCRPMSFSDWHTQKKWCACVHMYKGYYLTIVKKNQPQMYEDLVDFFDDPDAEQEEWQ